MFFVRCTVVFLRGDFSVIAMAILFRSIRVSPIDVSIAAFKLFDVVHDCIITVLQMLEDLQMDGVVDISGGKWECRFTLLALHRPEQKG